MLSARRLTLGVMSQESLDIPTEWWLDWSGLPDRLTGMDFAEP
jgi:hypothetical protein